MAGPGSRQHTALCALVGPPAHACAPVDQPNSPRQQRKTLAHNLARLAPLFARNSCSCTPCLHGDSFFPSPPASLETAHTCNKVSHTCRRRRSLPLWPEPPAAPLTPSLLHPSPLAAELLAAQHPAAPHPMHDPVTPAPLPAFCCLFALPFHWRGTCWPDSLHIGLPLFLCFASCLALFVCVLVTSCAYDCVREVKDVRLCQVGWLDRPPATISEESETERAQVNSSTACECAFCSVSC